MDYLADVILILSILSGVERAFLKAIWERVEERERLDLEELPFNRGIRQTIEVIFRRIIEKRIFEKTYDIADLAELQDIIRKELMASIRANSERNERIVERMVRESIVLAIRRMSKVNDLQGLRKLITELSREPDVCFSPIQEKWGFCYFLGSLAFEVACLDVSIIEMMTRDEIKELFRKMDEGTKALKALLGEGDDRIREIPRSFEIEDKLSDLLIGVGALILALDEDGIDYPDWKALELECLLQDIEMAENEGFVLGNPKLWNSTGVFFIKIQKPEKAIRYFLAVLVNDPSDYIAWYNLGIAYMKLKDSKAIRCFEKCVEIDPKNVISWRKLGAAYLMFKDEKKAAECFEMAIVQAELNHHDFERMKNERRI